MSDEDETRRAAAGEPPAGDARPPGEPCLVPGALPFVEPEQPGDPDAALRSLAKLEALGRDEASGRGETPAGGEVPDSPQGPPPARIAAPSRRRPVRVVSVSRPAGGWTRYVAPVAFLVAVIVLVSVAFQSGVVGGGDKKSVEPAAKPTKTATKSPKPSASAKTSTKPSAKPSSTSTAASAATTTYSVKAGDTLSGIAARFGTSVTDLEDLNAGTDLTTLHPGQKLIVPAP
jgi:LysM repeat protein